MSRGRGQGGMSVTLPGQQRCREWGAEWGAGRGPGFRAESDPLCLSLLQGPRGLLGPKGPPGPPGPPVSPLRVCPVPAPSCARAVLWAAPRADGCAPGPALVWGVGGWPGGCEPAGGGRLGSLLLPHTRCPASSAVPGMPVPSLRVLARTLSDSPRGRPQPVVGQGSVQERLPAAGPPAQLS